MKVRRASEIWDETGEPWGTNDFGASVPGFSPGLLFYVYSRLVVAFPLPLNEAMEQQHADTRVWLKGDEPLITLGSYEFETDDDRVVSETQVLTRGGVRWVMTETIHERCRLVR